MDSSSQTQLEMLDPFVPLLTNSLTSQNVKLLSRSLHCVAAVLGFLRDGLGGRSLQSGGRDPAGGPGLGLRIP